MFSKSSLVNNTLENWLFKKTTVTYNFNYKACCPWIFLLKLFYIGPKTFLIASLRWPLIYSFADIRLLCMHFQVAQNMFQWCAILFSVLCYIFFVSPCFNRTLWWQSKVSCVLSLSFYAGCKSPFCCKQCFQNHSTLLPPICYHTECWALQYCAFNSNLMCSSLSDVNFALVIPFFLAQWLQCKQHHISWLLIPDYTIEIANNVRVIK